MNTIFVVIYFNQNDGTQHIFRRFGDKSEATRYADMLNEKKGTKNFIVCTKVNGIYEQI